MSVVTVLARLAALQLTIPGIVQAFVDPPNSIASADMPLFFNLAADGTYDDEVYGDGAYMETRNYQMNLVVGAIGTGGSWGELPERCKPFFSEVKQFFAARPSLGGLVGVQGVVVTGDSGIVGIQIGGGDYVGIRFQLQVQEVGNYVFNTGE